MYQGGNCKQEDAGKEYVNNLEACLVLFTKMLLMIHFLRTHIAGVKVQSSVSLQRLSLSNPDLLKGNLS